MNEVRCDRLGCRNQQKRVVIGRTNGTEGEFWCGEHRGWVLWKRSGSNAFDISKPLVSMKL